MCLLIFIIIILERLREKMGYTPQMVPNVFIHICNDRDFEIYQVCSGKQLQKLQEHFTYLGNADNITGSRRITPPEETIILNNNLEVYLIPKSRAYSNNTSICQSAVVLRTGGVEYYCWVETNSVIEMVAKYGCSDGKILRPLRVGFSGQLARLTTDEDAAAGNPKAVKEFHVGTIYTNSTGTSQYVFAGKAFTNWKYSSKENKITHLEKPISVYIMLSGWSVNRAKTVISADNISLENILQITEETIGSESLLQIFQGWVTVTKPIRFKNPIDNSLPYGDSYFERLNKLFRKFDKLILEGPNHYAKAYMKLFGLHLDKAKKPQFTEEEIAKLRAKI